MYHTVTYKWYQFYQTRYRIESGSKLCSNSKNSTNEIIFKFSLEKLYD